MIAHKPLPQKRIPPRTQSRTRAMTIGIGMLCNGGVVIAADTQVVYSDGSTSQMCKVRTASLQHAAFAAAFASSDVPATETLLSDIFDDLRKSTITSLSECEMCVRTQMVKWDSSHPHGAPDTEFILGAAMQGESALYHCRPPNSMNRKEYIAVGQGAAIVDPIRSIFFLDCKGPKTTLRQVAYLMFRAKNDYASACGGLTNGIFLKHSPPSIFEISTSSMLISERSGFPIDGALKETMAALIDGELPDLQNSRNADRAKQTWGFLTNTREVIEDDGTVRKLP